MRVTLLFYPPFSDLVDKEVFMEFANECKVDFKDIITEFVEQYPRVRSLLPSVNDERIIYGNLMPVRDDKVLNLKDAIFDHDVIKIYGSLSGG